jgi:cytochrome b
MNVQAKDTGTVLIWDLPLRLFHWLLAVSILGSWLTHRQGAKGVDDTMLRGN